jgi:hypothetical protein
MEAYLSEVVEKWEIFINAGWKTLLEWLELNS